VGKKYQVWLESLRKAPGISRQQVSGLSGGHETPLPKFTQLMKLAQYAKFAKFALDFSRLFAHSSLPANRVADRVVS
jgi:hypothetical protein